MIEPLRAWAEGHRDAMQSFLRRCCTDGRPLLLHTDLRDHYRASAEAGDNPLAAVVRCMQEAVLRPPWACFAVREDAGRWHYLRAHLDEATPERIGIADYLRFKERLVAPEAETADLLEVDFGPFNREFPRLKEIRSIGQGVLFLNRHLSSAMFQKPAEGHARLLEFLRLHALEGRQLMLYEHLRDVAALREALREAQAFLDTVAPDTPWAVLAEPLGRLGFAPGWGDAATRVADTMSLLTDILEAPSPQVLETFLARIPMISRLLILSPHGWFAQDGVLGRPDTGGQVVYILDQVRALEREMRDRLAEQGVVVEPRILVVTRLIPDADGTTCDQPLEPIHGCERAAILLVIGGHVDPAASGDAEERDEIQRMHALMDRHGLDGEMRWLGARLDKALAGEIYRVVADRGGVFAQPALFEAFGLTLIEAMASGLPVFATRHGGPLEIIQHGVSGFHIDPNDGAAAADLMADFLERCATDPEHWRRLSRGALARVDARYTWRRYAERMMTLSRIYGFWKFVSNLEREETALYLRMFRHLQFRPLARAIP